MVRLSKISILVVTLSLYFIAKFNCTVPGTLHDFTNCNITTVTMVSLPTDSASDSTTTTQNIIVTSIYTTLNANPLHQAFYVLAGLGGGILVLTFCTITMCIYFCPRLTKRKRQVLAFTADNVYTMEVDEQSQQQHGI